MAIGTATKMGWKRKKSGDKFQIVIELDYAPGWPIDVVWRASPIVVELFDDGAGVVGSPGLEEKS